MLAGVSVDYYTRLEQGREHNPSPSVLNALASALELTADGRGHAFRLAGLAPTGPASVAPEVVDDALLALLESWPQTPALILNRQLDVLATNELARALYSNFDRINNLARMTFTDPTGRSFFTDWERAAETCIAHLRLALGYAGSGDQTRALVAEIYDSSSEFRRLWRQHDVRGKTHEAKTFHHGDVGDLRLEYNAFDVRSAPSQQLIVYSAPARTASADKLQLLGVLTTTRLPTA